ncbi:MAG: methyltransferase domain-containing protein [Vicinamibacterales bacterium]
MVTLTNHKRLQRRQRHNHLVVVAVVSISALLLFASSHGRTLFASQDEPTFGQDGKDVEWVPSPSVLVETMLTLAEVDADDQVIDLGSGDGRTVLAAAERGAMAVGVEYDAGLVQVSCRQAEERGLSGRATFVEADLFDVDLTSATVVTMFLLPDLNLKLRPSLLSLAPGTRVVSNTWDMGDWIADETVQLDPCPGFCTALLWIVPAQIEGDWTDSETAFTLRQEFQEISGTVTRNGQELAILDGRLSGRLLEFRTERSRYQGQVSGNTIRGTVITDDQTHNWIATQ